MLLFLRRFIVSFCLLVWPFGAFYFVFFSLLLCYFYLNVCIFNVMFFSRKTKFSIPNLFTSFFMHISMHIAWLYGRHNNRCSHFLVLINKSCNIQRPCRKNKSEKSNNKSNKVNSQLAAFPYAAPLTRFHATHALFHSYRLPNFWSKC